HRTTAALLDDGEAVLDHHRRAEQQQEQGKQAAAQQQATQGQSHNDDQAVEMERVMKEVRQHLPEGLGASGTTEIAQLGVTQDAARSAPSPVRAVACRNAALTVLRMTLVALPVGRQVGEIIAEQLCHGGSLPDEVSGGSSHS